MPSTQRQKAEAWAKEREAWKGGRWQETSALQTQWSGGQEGGLWAAKGSPMEWLEDVGALL